jgi:uncharacterized damage-inducible protein DinB
MANLPEPWLRGPVDGIAPVLQPAAHALLQALEDIEALAPTVSPHVLWRSAGAATAGFHAIHLAGALDRLLTYARGERLSDEQKAALRAEATPQTGLDGQALADIVRAAIDKALAQLRDTAAATVLESRAVGRNGLPSTVLGLIFHAAEHSTRHTGQFITTVKLLATPSGNAGG